MNSIPQAHPTVTINLEEYGCEGTIVMSQIDVMRKIALQNAVTTYLFTDEQVEKMKEIKDRDKFLRTVYARKLPMMMLLQVLATVTKAPFHLNDYLVEPELDLRSFTSFISDKHALYDRMTKALAELGEIDPLSC